MWHSDSASQVALVLTLSAADETSYNSTIVDFTEDPESQSASLRIQNANNFYCDNADRLNPSFTLIASITLLASVLITRCSSSTLCLVIVGLFVAVSLLHVSANDCTERADVAIHVPRLTNVFQ